MVMTFGLDNNDKAIIKSKGKDEWKKKYYINENINWK